MLCVPDPTTPTFTCGAPAALKEKKKKKKHYQAEQKNQKHNKQVRPFEVFGCSSYIIALLRNGTHIQASDALSLVRIKKHSMLHTQTQEQGAASWWNPTGNAKINFSEKNFA